MRASRQPRLVLPEREQNAAFCSSEGGGKKRLTKCCGSISLPRSLPLLGDTRRPHTWPWPRPRERRHSWDGLRLRVAVEMPPKPPRSLGFRCSSSGAALEK